MDEIRTLPPLVRGKVTGFLDLFIDEVRIFRNILLLADNCDIMVQVQWWGEKLPVFIIPQQFGSKPKQNLSYNCQNTYFHSATYKIKTKLDLFKSYLKTCDVLELAVLKAVENLVIGSAFMKDLISLINNNHDQITLPLVDSLGEEIGEVKIHTNFSQGSCRISKNECFSQSIEKGILSNKSDVNRDSEKIKSECLISNKIVCERCSSNFKQKDMYKINQVSKIFQPQKIQDDVLKKQLNSLSEDGNLYKNRTCENEISPEDDKNKKCGSGKNTNKNEDFICTKKEFKIKSFPQTNVINDSSTVLYFDLQHGKQPKNTKKCLKSEKPVSRNIDVNSVKSKQKLSKFSQKSDQFSAKFKSSSVKKKITSENMKSVENSQKALVKTQNREREKSDGSKKPTKTIDVSAQSHLNPQNCNEKGNEKILNYLLGYNMSKDDEESALDNLRRMSLSHNFVESINQLCTTTENSSQKPKLNSEPKFTSYETLKKQFQTPTNASTKISRLKFDLNNTIERNYFKKFFSTSECGQNAFQIAEFLNPTKNNFVVDNCCKMDDVCLNELSVFQSNSGGNEVDKDSINSTEFQGAGYDLSIKNETSNPASSFWAYEKIPTDCSDCKYYKQFSELDTIIESLKHFDKKSVKGNDK